MFGAGVSRACGLPDVAALQKAVAKDLNGSDHKTFESMLEDRNLEEVLSHLRRIAALLEDGQKLSGLDKKGAEALDGKICASVVSHLALEKANLDPMRKFAAWAVGTEYHRALEIFTVNYDLIVESALEELSALWFDGFIGALQARFRVDLVEGFEAEAVLPPEFVRLWKLHGSLNWAWRGDSGSIVRLGGPAGNSDAAAIYPADTKYEESRRVPFVVLMDRFRRALNEPETLLLVSGYSFKDQHLDELIFDAAVRHPRSEFVVFCHSNIPDQLAEKAESTPSLSVLTKEEAILGTQRAKWEAQKDAEGMEMDAKGVWGEGEFVLSDFAGLATFLARSSRAVDDEDE
jgi:SIR2-like domain